MDYKCVNGQCYDFKNTYVCDCNYGWTGETCAIGNDILIYFICSGFFV
jgi:hypothetical protein